MLTPEAALHTPPPSQVSKWSDDASAVSMPISASDQVRRDALKKDKLLKIANEDLQKYKLKCEALASELKAANKKRSSPKSVSEDGSPKKRKKTRGKKVSPMASPHFVTSYTTDTLTHL